MASDRHPLEGLREAGRAQEAVWASTQDSAAKAKLRAGMIARVGEKGLQRLLSGYARRDARERERVESK